MHIKYYMGVERVDEAVVIARKDARQIVGAAVRKSIAAAHAFVVTSVTIGQNLWLQKAEVR